MSNYQVPPFLAELLHARSPSGYESEAQAVFDRHVKPAADLYANDALGNRIATLNPKGDPVLMLEGPIPATRKLLGDNGLTIGDIDVVEINEAFASVVLAWQKETGFDPAKVNVNGGAIALGHPLGATGARLMTTLLCELERTGGRYGLQTMCEGGGMANATIIERLG